MRKLCLSTKFLHQEIGYNYGILRSDGPCTKYFDALVKDHYFIRFHNGSRNVFANTSKGNCFFIFVVMLLKQVRMGRKKYLFHFQVCFDVLNKSYGNTFKSGCC